MKHKQALARSPGANFADGLTTSGLGKPDIDKAIAQHQRYCSILESCGVAVTSLPALSDYPDCPFVEDTAIITEDCAVITRPGDESRRGEEDTIREILQHHRTLEFITAPGTVDGGDVLRIDRRFYIGISKRTNLEGAEQLSRILSKYDFDCSAIPVAAGLHLKSGLAYIDGNNLIAINEFADRQEFQSFNIIRVNSEEEYAANCLLVNETLLIPYGFPKISGQVKALGYKTIEVEMSEFQKMDGGLTCLSLLF